MQQLTRVKNKKIKIILGEEKLKDKDGYSSGKVKRIIKEVYANVRNLRGKEFYQAAQVQSQDDKIFYCNWFPELTSKAHIEYRQELYKIVAPPININEENKEYEIRVRLVK